MAEPRRAYLLCGPSLAGKSSAARRIAEALEVVVLSADAINEERGLPFGGENLPESVWAETLEIQLRRFHQLVTDGRSVVVDDTLCYRWLRDRWRETARLAGAPSELLLLAPAAEELWRRHARVRSGQSRHALSEDSQRRHMAAFEWPTVEERAVDITEAPALEAWLASERQTRASAERSRGPK
jgi:predicted kinase